MASLPCTGLAGLLPQRKMEECTGLFTHTEDWVLGPVSAPRLQVTSLLRPCKCSHNLKVWLKHLPTVFLQWWNWVMWSKQLGPWLWRGVALGPLSEEGRRHRPSPCQTHLLGSAMGKCRADSYGSMERKGSFAIILRAKEWSYMLKNTWRFTSVTPHVVLTEFFKLRRGTRNKCDY